ncbi:2'-5' RNA ligase family protein [Nocardia sp. CA-107356]|uniref:2'-5' RNA ligase family protein n=1 Tax=Nocardia sp. CA-107356 TaxID=3239972 RepID=UPI003D91F477
MTAPSKRPFPLLRPTSTSEPSIIQSNDWSAFRGLNALHDHWTLKGWAPGRSGYYWYLTFSDPALADLASECQGQLGTDSLDPVSLDRLHLTLLSIGDADQVSDSTLTRLIDLVHRRLAGVKAFDLSVGPLAGSRSAIRFSVAPWDPLLDLHRSLRECTAAVRPNSQLTETSEFRPHLGIAYINKQQAANGLVGAVEQLRDLAPVPVRVDNVHLVELRRAGRQYVWRDHAVISLAIQPSSGAAKCRADKDHSRRLSR